MHSPDCRSDPEMRVQIPSGPINPFVLRGGSKSRAQKISRFEFKSFCNQLEIASYSISKERLEELRAIIVKAHKKRFRRSREPKYGSISKAFTDKELQLFMRNVKNAKFRLLFKYQAYLGLRVGEAVCFHTGNINFEKRELTIKSEKSSQMDALKIPAELFQETRLFVSEHIEEIKAAQGYIFFKDNDNNHNKALHIDVNYARKVFRETIRAAGLDDSYGYSEETDENRKERRLHRLTTHSLRHYAITRFAKSTNGNVVLSCRFARHADPSTTMRYIAKDKEELFRNIDMVFEEDKIKNLQCVFQARQG
jgi:integrase